MELLSRGEPGNDLPPISFELRMAVVYRAEKKKILRSQVNLVKKILSVLRRIEEVLRPGEEQQSDTANRAYTELILEET